MIRTRALNIRLIVVLALIAFVLGIGTSAFALERKLAGVTLGEKMSFVLKKFGNPTRVSIGASGGLPSTLMPSPGAMPGMTPPGTNTGGNLRGVRPMPVRDLSPFAGLAPGALPGLPTVGGMPGTGQDMYNPAGTGTPGSTENAPSEEDVRWVYEFGSVKKPIFEFIINDGIIAQITASGTKAPTVKTAKGVTLGDSYKKVLLAYGYPDKQEYVGNYLRVGYLQRSNMMFTLRDSKTVVGITIGFKE